MLRATTPGVVMEVRRRERLCEQLVDQGEILLKGRTRERSGLNGRHERRLWDCPDKQPLASHRTVIARTAPSRSGHDPPPTMPSHGADRIDLRRAQPSGVLMSRSSPSLAMRVGTSAGTYRP